MDSEIGKALENVGLLSEDGVELFLNLNDALECRCFFWLLLSFLRVFLGRDRKCLP